MENKGHRRQVHHWDLVVVWEDGLVEVLDETLIPEVVLDEIKTYISELEDFENGGWDTNDKDKVTPSYDVVNKGEI
jgi:hypothetical protein